MRTFKFDRNVRFSFLLPYGICSQQALMLAVEGSDYAYIPYDPKVTVEERIAKCRLNYKVRLRMISAMEELGYIEKFKRSIGKEGWEYATYYRFTQAGWYYLTNTPNDAVEEARLAKIPRLKNRNKKEINYFPQTTEFLCIQGMLYDIAARTDTTARDHQLFEETFLESVQYDNLSILASEPYLAEKVQVASGMRAGSLARCWKLANIEALFKANSYLTTIDRRHITDLNKPDKTDRAEKAETARMEVRDFCNDTLGAWYKKYPSSYIYAEPLEIYASHIIEEWKNTPAFYEISELDDAIIEVQTDTEMNEKRTTKSYRILALGVAVGNEKNYVVHHTRNGGTPWIDFIEKNTLATISKRFEEEEKKEPVLGTNRNFHDAIIVCSSVGHFASLFKETCQRNKPESKREYRIGMPYDSVSIIPINPSGAMQLRVLMQSSPQKFERAICNFLLQHDGFAKRPAGNELHNNIYPISYKQTPVLVAHTMDWRKLAIARDQYEDGRKFYVSCYPEQVKYIRSIMPEVEIL